MSGPWRLDGQVAIVTGAGRGLGYACAAELAEAGALVMMVSRSVAELQAAATAVGKGAVARVADVSDPMRVAELVDEAANLGALTVLVAAAGTNRTGAARDYPMADWDLLFDLNVRATFLTCQRVGDELLRGGRRGSIVAISSQMGAVGYPGRVAYCATKHAVEGMVKALAVEWAAQGIRVNAVAPTFVETPLTAPMLADPGFRSEVLARIPTGRLATTEDVARAVRYLACPASASVTGHVLRVDGGWTAW